MPNLFDSIFTTTTTSVDPLLLLLALATSLLLGGALSWVYRHRTLYTREFAITIILLPSLMSLVIFLVNGSLGTSIAVAGTFSLIRFRSATSGSRELLAIFMSMIIGLAVGSGFLILAVVSTLLILMIWFFLDQHQTTAIPQTSRYLSITYQPLPSDSNSIEHLLKNYCQHYQLITLKSTQDGHNVTAEYELSLKDSSDDFPLLNALHHRLQTSTINISTKAKKRKNL